MHNFCENIKLVVGVSPADNEDAISGDFVSMKTAGHITVIAVIAQGHATPTTISIQQAKDVSGTDVKALAKDVPIWANLDAAAGDTLVRQDDGVSLATGAALKNKIIIFEIDAADLDTENGFTAIRAAAAASNALNLVSILYAGSVLRYGVGHSLVSD